MFAPNISTQSLSLIPVTINHVTERYVSWLNDPEVNVYLESGGDYTLKKLEDFIKEIINGNKLFWAIHKKESGKHIGNIKIDPINDRHLFAEYGILMGDKSEWGKGYAKEATQAIINYCFEELKLRKICLGVVEDNTSAVELYKKLNFLIEGRYIKHGFYQGKWCNVIRMALFNSAIKE